jgi:hypothetical protein
MRTNKASQEKFALAPDNPRFGAEVIPRDVAKNLGEPPHRTFSGVNGGSLTMEIETLRAKLGIMPTETIPEYHCKACGVLLVIDENWRRGTAMQRHYYCDTHINEYYKLTKLRRLERLLAQKSRM